MDVIGKIITLNNGITANLQVILYILNCFGYKCWIILTNLIIRGKLMDQREQPIQDQSQENAMQSEHEQIKENSLINPEVEGGQLNNGGEQPIISEVESIIEAQMKQKENSIHQQGKSNQDQMSQEIQQMQKDKELDSQQQGKQLKKQYSAEQYDNLPGKKQGLSEKEIIVHSALQSPQKIEPQLDQFACVKQQQHPSPKSPVQAQQQQEIAQLPVQQAHQAHYQPQLVSSSPSQVQQQVQEAIQIQQKEDQDQKRKILEAELIHQQQLEKLKDIKERQKLEDLKKKEQQENFAYLNRIERKLQAKYQQVTQLSKQLANLKRQNNLLKESNSSAKESNQQLRKTKWQLEMEKAKISKELQLVKLQNSEQKDRLAEVQKIGNIFILQNTIEDLKLLVDTQTRQIEQLKTRKQNQEEDSSKFKEYFKEVEQKHKQINQLLNDKFILQTKAEEVVLELQNTIKLKVELEEEIKLANQRIFNTEKQKSSLAEKLSELQSKWQSVQEQRIEFKRVRQLDQRVIQYESQRHMGEETNIQLIPTMSDKQEKAILLRQFLILQAKYEENKIKLDHSQLKIKRIQRENRHRQANFIKKKEYSNLLSRYNKAKTCLEGAFSRLKKLEKNQSSLEDIRQQVNELLDGNEARLCQTLIKKTTEQFKLVHDKINEMQTDNEVFDLRNQNKKIKQAVTNIEDELKCNERIMYLMNEQLMIKKKTLDQKNQLIKKLINNGYHHSNQHYTEIIDDLKRQIDRLREDLLIFETKNVILIRQNQAFQGQIAHWKQLYNSLKLNFSGKISQSLIQSQAKPIDNKMDIQKAQNCKQCQLRSLSEINKKETVQFQTQVEGLYQYHYKEIKQCLHYIKKIREELENIPELQQKTMKIIAEYKEKYQKIFEKYNTKFLELKKDKGQLQSWRSKARQEIRDQFQQIREMISNNRLAIALRQAKSLIEYLEGEITKYQEQESEKREESNMEENNESEKKAE